VTEYQRNSRGSIDEDIAHLQEIVLKAAILGQRLPGLQKPIIIPFSRLFRHDAAHPLLLDNLSPALNLNNVPEVLRPMSAAEYLSRAPRNPGDWYLMFQPPDISPSRIRLVISALRGEPGSKPPPVEIGNLQAEFHFSGGRWEAVTMPSLFISNGTGTDPASFG
jgi:hypothetical protein